MAKILIVDDEPSIRMLLKIVCERAGHETREAGSAEDALVDIAAHPSDVVLVDLVMPGRGGLWLTEQLRVHHPHAALVLATGISTVPARQSMQEGVVDYIVKPFDRQSVLEAVDTAATWSAHMAATRAVPSPFAPSLEEWADALEC